MNAMNVVIPSTILIAAMASSVHCAGMCGPLVMNLNSHRQRGLYHLGRLFTYAGLGALAGTFGHTLLNQWSWVTAVAVAVLFGVVVMKGASALHAHHLWPLLAPYWKRLANATNRPSGLFACGILAGFLPCGQIHGFVLAAAVSRSPWSGMLILVALWTGSLPGLYFGPPLIRKMLARFPVRARQWAITLIAIAGIFTLTAFLA